MSTQKKIKLDGGEFILKDIPSNEVFTAEDFSEEQKMMRDSVIEFNEREVIAKKSRFEAKEKRKRKRKRNIKRTNNKNK